jgi:hypothetical protein
MTSAGHNLEVGNSCGLGASGDKKGVADAKLGPFGGGPPSFYPLLSGSPAIDAADNTGCPSTDERGASRPQDGNGTGVAVCDIGAYEASGIPQATTLRTGGGPSGPSGPTLACALGAKTTRATAASLRKASAARRAKLVAPSLALTISCTESANVTITGQITETFKRKGRGASVGRKRRRARPRTRKITLSPTSTTVSAGVPRTITLRLPASAAKALTKKKARESATFTITATTATGHATTATARLSSIKALKKNRRGKR